jgi:para-nitrobenzyl esterase
MVWIQGGMFEISSTVAYNGRHFARDGVVCVVINWRPGAEGFLALGDGIANVGLLDQVAALEWVRENIAAFGGDPANVTIFGESAGAMSIGTLLSMPRAEGLFRRAIAQSGAAHHVSQAGTARRTGRYLAEKLGVPPTREAIAALPVERLLTAQAQLKAELLAHPDPERWGQDVVTSMMPWQPVIDGDVLPGSPIDRIAAGAGAQVDVIAGTNADDWRLFLALTGAIDQITDQILTGPVAVYGYQALAAYGLPVELALAAYRDEYPGAGPGDLLAAVQTDWWVRIPPSAWPTPTPAPPRAPGCTSSGGPHPASAPSTPSRSPSSSTP